LRELKDEEQRATLLKQAMAKNLSLNEIKMAVKELTPEAALTLEKMVAQRWSEIGKQLQKTKGLERSQEA
jgi:ParB family chromosome partitioning protein